MQLKADLLKCVVRSDICDYVLFYVHIQRDDGKEEFKMCGVFLI